MRVLVRCGGTGCCAAWGMALKRRRLLILVVAYHAESTLVSVLDRIPRSVLETHDCEVLVVDDASEDETFLLGQRYATDHPELPVRVFRNRINQGYGGNQKVGYTWAIEHGFDLVAMIHGDGQYAPEELPRLLAPFDDDPALGAVFGSRMLDRGGARRGGMPLYKYVGNRILTTVQNVLLRTDFSELHSGYRVYNVAALQAVHYRLDTADFHFDTEIVLQLLAAEFRILELPIPTYYGDEISRVNGLAYAWNVLKVTLQYFLHGLGLRQQRRFDPMEGGSPYEEKLGYPSSHQWALDAVPDGARVLDLGGGPGHVTRQLMARGCTVTCVDRQHAGPTPPGVRVIAQDLEDDFSFDPGEFDVILLLDVVEHMKDPDRFLERLRRYFDHQPRRVILTTGNVAFAPTRFSLLFGQFNYGARGILDRDHSRLFTFRSVRHLLRDAGLTVRELRGVPAPFPLAVGDGMLARVLLAVNLGLIRMRRTMFSFQIFAVADTTPDLEFLIRDAELHSQTAVAR